MLGDWLMDFAAHPSSAIVVHVFIPAAFAGLMTLAIREKDKVGFLSTREKRFLFCFFLLFIIGMLAR